MDIHTTLFEFELVWSCPGPDSLFSHSPAIHARSGVLRSAVFLVFAPSLHLLPQLTELESTAHFPEEMNSLRQVMEGVIDYNSLRQQLTADMADSSQR